MKKKTLPLCCILGTLLATIVSAFTTQTIFHDWAAGFGVSTDPNVVGANGLKNLLNFAFGINPTLGFSGALVFNGNFTAGGTIGNTSQPIIRFEAIPNGIDFRALFVRRKDFAAAGLTCTPQFSAHPPTFADSTDTLTVLADDGTNQIVSVHYPPFLIGKKARFFQVQVTLAP